MGGDAGAILVACRQQEQRIGTRRCFVRYRLSTHSTSTRAPAWQRGYLHGRTCRIGQLEESGHHFIDPGEVREVGEVDVHLHRIVQRTARGFGHGLEVLEHARGLGFDLAAHQLAGGLDPAESVPT